MCLSVALGSTANTRVLGIHSGPLAQDKVDRPLLSMAEMGSSSDFRKHYGRIKKHMQRV